jgi:plasmid stabilization system protein ParE
MVKLIWTDQAITDLGDIGDYIAENSEKYAKLTVKKLFERPDILKTYPQAGRIVPEKNEENLREFMPVDSSDKFGVYLESIYLWTKVIL